MSCHICSHRAVIHTPPCYKEHQCYCLIVWWRKIQKTVYAANYKHIKILPWYAIKQNPANCKDKPRVKWRERERYKKRTNPIFCTHATAAARYFSPYAHICSKDSLQFQRGSIETKMQKIRNNNKSLHVKKHTQGAENKSARGRGRGGPNITEWNNYLYI